MIKANWLSSHCFSNHFNKQFFMGKFKAAFHVKHLYLRLLRKVHYICLHHKPKYYCIKLKLVAILP
jgi:hypothetical protein